MCLPYLFFASQLKASALAIHVCLCAVLKVESAWGVGDRFSPGASMAMDACATLLGACLGSPYPTGIYLGQPAFKAMGSR